MCGKFSFSLAPKHLNLQPQAVWIYFCMPAERTNCSVFAATVGKIFFSNGRISSLKQHLQPPQKAAVGCVEALSFTELCIPMYTISLLASCLSVEHLCLFCMTKLFLSFAKMSSDVGLWVCGFSVG